MDCKWRLSYWGKQYSSHVVHLNIRALDTYKCFFVFRECSSRCFTLTLPWPDVLLLLPLPFTLVVQQMQLSSTRSMILIHNHAGILWTRDCEHACKTVTTQGFHDQLQLNLQGLNVLAEACLTRLILSLSVKAKRSLKEMSFRERQRNSWVCFRVKPPQLRQEFP